MTAIPFIYFFALALCQLRNNMNRVDLAFVIAVMYGISGFLSIFVEKMNLTGLNYHPSLIATIVYCVLITICWYPLSKHSNLSIRNVKPIDNPKLLQIVTWVSFIWFIFFLYLSFDRIIMVINGDMYTLRSLIYSGDGVITGHKIPFFINVPYVLCRLLFGCPWIFVFLSFFCKFVQKLPDRYFYILLIVSLSGPLEGVIFVDRSKTTYWIISVGVNYLFFYKYMSHKQRKGITILLAILCILCFVYLSLVTTSRFEDYESGVQGGLVYYLGQSYIYFTYFFDNFTPPYKTFAIFMPSFYHFILGDELVGGTVLQREWDERTGFSTGVFYTYMGHIMIFAGFLTLVIVCCLYNFVANKILKRIKTDDSTIYTLFMYQAISSVLSLGVFVHYYASYTLTSSLIFFFFFIKKLAKN